MLVANGLELSRKYFFDTVEPHLKLDFPALYPRIAAGLAGNGSECFGFDDEISRDHDWGIDFFLWVPEIDRASLPALQSWKQNLFIENPPEFARTRSPYGAIIGAMTAGDFYRSLIGLPNAPTTIDQWRQAPEENYAMAVNGAVFIDGMGEFSATRQKLLDYFPEDLRKKRIASCCMALAQTGQYNLIRCAKRGDPVTIRMTLSRFNDNAIAMVFLLNRVFRPYYKWAFRSMRELHVLGTEIGGLLRHLSAIDGFSNDSFQEQRMAADEICALLIKELHQQGLAFSDDKFLATHGEEVQASIKNATLRALPAQYEI
jgi:hypothetical protein